MSGRNIWGCGLGRARSLRGGRRERGRQPGEGWHLPQALQVGSGARRVLRLRGRWSGGSPKEGTKPAGRRHHLPDSALEQLGIDGGEGAPNQARDPGKLAGGHSAGLAGQIGSLESAGGRFGDKGKGPARAAPSGMARKSHVEPAPAATQGEMRDPGHGGGKESAGRERRGLYLGSSEQLRSLQVGEDGRDAVRERVAQEGGILGKEKGRGTPVTALAQPTVGRWGAGDGTRRSPRKELQTGWEPGQAPESGAESAEQGRRGRAMELETNCWLAV